MSCGRAGSAGPADAPVAAPAPMPLAAPTSAPPPLLAAESSSTPPPVPAVAPTSPTGAGSCGPSRTPPSHSVPMSDCSAGRKRAACA
eukprot:364323-Chlamydomonas_euryale.AAC.13